MTLSPTLIWAILGIVLIIVELLTGTFFFLFIGIGAIITAIVAYFGVGSIHIQFIIFAISSIILILLLRKMAKKLFYGHADLPPEYIGEKVPVAKEIPVGHEGSVKYRGSFWIAYSDEIENIPEGTLVEVIGSDGIKLKVKKI